MSLFASRTVSCWKVDRVLPLTCSYWSMIDSDKSLGWWKTVFASGNFQINCVSVENNGKASVDSNETSMVPAIKNPVCVYTYIYVYTCLFFPLVFLFTRYFVFGHKASWLFQYIAQFPQCFLGIKHYNFDLNQFYVQYFVEILLS